MSLGFGLLVRHEDVTKKDCGKLETFIIFGHFIDKKYI